MKTIVVGTDESRFKIISILKVHCWYMDPYLGLFSVGFSNIIFLPEPGYGQGVNYPDAGLRT